MGKILIIVESPHKTECLKSFLGSGYCFMASKGCIMDLDPKCMAIDIENNFKPSYVEKADRKDVITHLKEMYEKVDEIYIATDPDREGEMIAWTIARILKIKEPIRLRFGEITKSAVLKAIENRGTLDRSLIDAQKARRFLDRIVGYTLSPILHKIFKIGNLSAGRVQSVLLRLIVDREKEIAEFLNGDISSFFRFTGLFAYSNDIEIKGTIKANTKVDDEKNEDEENENDEFKDSAKITSKKKADDLMNKIVRSIFKIDSNKDNETKRKPQPPYKTSTLQQDSFSKLGISVKNTMLAAQHLYEAGLITYMRTDSINLSEEFIGKSKKYIIDQYGEKYHKTNRYKSKAAHTQEAHEAIRPTNVKKSFVDIGGKIGINEQRLYKLIWQRSVASQMVPAEVSIRTIKISISETERYYFEGKAETILFEGFLIVYGVKSAKKNDDLTIGKEVKPIEIICKQDYKKPPYRYNEKSLCVAIDEDHLNIGRPATSASFIHKIQDRNYIVLDETTGLEKHVITYKWDGKTNGYETSESTIVLGKEKNKFVPTPLGTKVTELLVKHFGKVMDYNFTAEMENMLDDIAANKMDFKKVLKDFYDEFDPNVKKLLESNENIKLFNDILLGKYPETDKDIFLCRGMKGGYHLKTEKDGKIQIANLYDKENPEKITLEEAIQLLKYPKHLGKIGRKSVVLHQGKNNFYVKVSKDSYSVNNEKYPDPDKITVNDVKDIIEEKKKNNLWEAEDENKIYVALSGPYGKYVKILSKEKKKKPFNVKIPVDFNIEELTIEKVEEFAKNKYKNRGRGKFVRVNKFNKKTKIM